MKRKIVSIDSELCNGCGLCVKACHEGALQMIDGKAVLVSDSYCDGLGDCLPECPTGAIKIVERDSAPYDEAAVMARQAAAQGRAAPAPAPAKPLPCGCPGAMAKAIARPAASAATPASAAPAGAAASELTTWPVQIKLVPVNAPYLANASLLVAADCTAFAYADIHRKFMRNKVTLIGCPKLDEGDYSEKLGAILAANDIKSVTVLRMEVPCCGGIAAAVKTALQKSGKMIPWQVVTISTDGAILED
jgi:ferredoxin